MLFDVVKRIVTGSQSFYILQQVNNFSSSSSAPAGLVCLANSSESCNSLSNRCPGTQTPSMVLFDLAATGPVWVPINYISSYC